jgi:hypothetical protein
MTNPYRLDERALRRMDDLQLEAVRLDLLRSSDERYEQVCEQLLVRGIGHVERVSRELCDLRGLSAEQHQAVVIDASVRLQLRLTREKPLASIATLAAQLTADCVAARTRTSQTRPRLAARAPRLRAVNTQLGDALRSGRLKPKGGPTS